MTDTKSKKDNEVYLVDEMQTLSDLDLVRVGLSALAVLHERAITVSETIAQEIEKEQKEGDGKVFNRQEYIEKHGSADAIPKSKED